jgi:tetratricopeptide (TPR) repeat protein
MDSKKLFPIILFIISLLIYLLTVCPTIYVGDSGEIISAAYHLGIPHPPGYPLYMIITKIFMSLPLSNIAYRGNIVAGFFGSISIIILFIFLKKIGSLYLSTYERIYNLVAFFISISLAFSETFWAQCVQAKGGIYTLNAFFLILILLLIILRSNIALIAIICGLSLTNHNTMVPLVFLFFIFILYQTFLLNKKDLLRVSLIFFILVALVSSFIYLYLPIRSLSNPPMDWGNPETISNALHHIFRGQYGTISEHKRSIGLFCKQLTSYIKLLFSQFTIIPLLFVPFGVFAFYKSLKHYMILLILIFLSTSLGFIILTNFSINTLSLYLIKVFYIPSYIVILIFAFFGILYLLSFIPQKIQSISSFLLVILPLLCLMSNYNYNDRSKNYFAYDYGINLLKSIDSGSNLLVAGDNTAFTTAYLTMVEKKGEDNYYYDDYGLIFSNIDSEIEKIPVKDYLKRLDYIENKLLNSDKPTFFVLGSNIYKDIQTTYSSQFSAEPVGLLYRVTKKGQKIQYKPFDIFKFRGLNDNSIYKDYMVRDIIAQYYFFYGEYLRRISKDYESNLYFQKANEIGYDNESIQIMLGFISHKQGDLKSALDLSKKAVEINPYSSEAWNNYGTALSRFGKIHEAIDAYKRAISIDPKIVTYYNNLAGAYFNIGDYQSALKTYEQSGSISEKGLDYYGLGLTYTKLGLIDNAINVYLKGLSLNPSSDIYYGLGNLYLNSGKVSEAIKYYNEGIKLNPNSDKIYNNLGVAYLKIGDTNRGIECFEKAVNINPKLIDAYSNLGKVYFSIGKKELSMRMFQKILEIDPSNRDIKLIIDRIKSTE